MKETVIESPLIGSGSQEEADNRVRILLELGTSRGYLTYEELNEKLPDEVVSPDKLDSLLMMIDEMGIKLIDEMDVGEFAAKPRGGARSAKIIKTPVTATGAVAGKGRSTDGKPKAVKEDEPDLSAEDDDEEIDLNLDKELAEASTKRIDDPVRMYLTQMGEIPCSPASRKSPWRRRSRSPARSSAAACLNLTTACKARSRFFNRSTTAICRSTAR
jgi:hypothetical protein